MGLDLFLELLVGFSGGSEPLKSTEVQQCGLAEFHPVFSRSFILEFDPVCLWDGSSNMLSMSAILMGFSGS